MLHKSYYIPIINDLFNFVAVVGLAPLHDGYEPCMRLSHFYRDIKKDTSFHNVSLLFYELTINNYTYINNNIMACEINDKYLAIPFVDIAADYNIKVLTIDKNHEIKVWDDPNDFDIILIP